MLLTVARDIGHRLIWHMRKGQVVGFWGGALYRRWLDIWERDKSSASNSAVRHVSSAFPPWCTAKHGYNKNAVSCQYLRFSRWLSSVNLSKVLSSSSVNLPERSGRFSCRYPLLSESFKSGNIQVIRFSVLMNILDDTSANQSKYFGDWDINLHGFRGDVVVTSSHLLGGPQISWRLKY